jgi:tetratricopeptide (TPR) repeat protein
MIIYMKRIVFIAFILIASHALQAQTSSRYEQRYDLLVSQFGPAGVGIETVLDNWAKVDSTNARLLQARFEYFFTKAQTGQVEPRQGKKYLGMEPVLTLKDSLGNDVNYFQVNVFDDGLYAEAIKAADKAIAVWPDRLDFRFMKANAYIAYEKESPDMALAYLLAMADEDRSRNKPWQFEGAQAQKGFFEEAMQEYCYSFYAINSEKALEAFFKLSEKMLEIYPENLGFLNNIGTYNMVAKQDFKTAIKCYDKVLKKNPKDYTAIRNAMLAARKMKNLKLEKKYLQMVVKHGPENEQKQAQARLDSMSK